MFIVVASNNTPFTLNFNLHFAQTTDKLYGITFQKNILEQFLF